MVLLSLDDGIVKSDCVRIGDMDPFSDLSVSNVYLYVGDAVRLDSLPDRLAERGTVIKTVAASIHTPTSFASLVTGLHPPQHGVEDFSYRLDEDIPNLLSLDGHTTAFANTIDEKFNENPESESVLDRTLNTTKRSPDVIETIEPPFVFLERGPGGHAPYGDYDGNAWDYYRERKAAPQSVFREEYRESVERDVDYFESQVECLDERGLLDDTLIIYTSDHGELLGEGGCLGHNTPIHPKLAYVPTVLIHPSINGRQVMDAILNHVDFLPTLADLLGMHIPRLPGRNLMEKNPSSWGACFYHKSLISNFSPLVSGDLRYQSVWDAEGGYVFPQTSLVNRLIILLGKLKKSAKREYMRHHLWDVFRFYRAGTLMYGHPTFTRQEAEEHLQEINNLDIRLDLASDLEVSEEQLRDLGYMS